MATLRLDFPVTKGSLVPSNLWCPLTSKYFRETAQKGAKKPQNLRNLHQHPETKNGPYLGLRGSKPNFEGT